MDIQKQAGRATYRYNATSEGVFNERYSHIPIDPGVPKGYYKDEPSFKHYREINERHLTTRKDNTNSDIPASARTPMRKKAPDMVSKSREINYSEL
jgi:hypothetical protein